MTETITATALKITYGRLDRYDIQFCLLFYFRINVLTAFVLLQNVRVNNAPLCCSSGRGPNSARHVTDVPTVSALVHCSSSSLLAAVSRNRTLESKHQPELSRFLF
jgi:hypothetical protein